MCQVHTGAYISLLASVKTDYTVWHPRKTTTYILHVVSIITHTHDKRKSVGKKKKQRTHKKIERNFGGLLASLPPERDVTWFFDGLQQYYERLSIHPHRSPDYRPITRSTAGRGCHVSLCWGPLCPASCPVLFK